MASTLPSLEIYASDVPEVRSFDANFVYNYHVADELISEDATNIPKNIVERSSEYFDSKYIDYLNTRVPRYVKFKFDTVKIKDVDTTSTNKSLKRQESIIRKNYSKIVGEDEFSLSTFKSLTFSDNNIDKKIHEFATTSLDQLLEQTGLYISTKNKKNEDYEKEVKARREKDIKYYKDINASLKDKITLLNGDTPENVTTDFIAAALNQFKYKDIFYNENKKQEEISKLSLLKDVYINCQVNGKVIQDLLESAYINSLNTISTNIENVVVNTANIQQTAIKNASEEYNAILQLDPINTTAISAGTSSTVTKKVIGYVIDKWRVDDAGTYESLEPIIIEDASVGTTVDFKIRYGGTYAYQVRTICEFSAPAKSGENTVIAKFLISSKPTKKIIISCIENVPPPPPNDLNFVWDYENRNLIITWEFPVNKQRDIKKFQIFRRSSIREPFQLLKVYDFDDTIRNNFTTYQGKEKINEKLVSFDRNPKTSYADLEFKKNSKFIYAICAIDAHGFSSNYSTQFEVTFDIFSNKVNKKIICISGCPKQFPNMNLMKDTFVDSMFHAGGSRMKLYFDPEYIEILDRINAVDSKIPVVMTDLDKSSYKISFINIDNQKQKILDVVIKDRRTTQEKSISTNEEKLISIDPNKFRT